MYVLTRTYDIDFRQWLAGNTASQPLLPSSDSLYNNFNAALATMKSISDTLIYHPVKYKVLFGESANADLQATFKIVKNSDEVTNDADIKSRVISAINEFFALENWDFGDTFYFTELSAFITLQLAPDISNFIIVPKAGNQSFGSLFEISSESDEIFISGAKVSDIEIIDAVTAAQIKATGTVTTSSTSTSSSLSGTLASSSSATGSTSSSSGGSSGGGSGY